MKTSKLTTLKTTLIVTVSLLAIAVFTMSPPTYAAEGDKCTIENSSILSLPNWYKYLEATEDSTGRCGPTVDGPGDALPIGVAILEAMIRLGGLVAVVMVFIGAFRYITTQGNPDTATTARKTIINALIGLVIVIIATSVVSFVGRSLSS